MKISFLLVTYNEIKYIEKCLNSILKQTYRNFELIIVDGGSNDGTIDFIKSFMMANNSEIDINLLNNPKKILAAGWNLAIQNARHEYVIRIDAHAEIPENFLAKNVEHMQNQPPEVAAVGGRVVTETDNTFLGRALNLFFSSKIGVGISFRNKSKAGYSYTVPFGLYRKSVFTEVGYFNEDFERAQDSEFHARVLKKGYKFYFAPDIASIYYSRNTIKASLRKLFKNGYWNYKNLRIHPEIVRLNHIIPGIFFVLSIVLTVLSLLGIGSVVFLFLVVLYYALLLMDLLSQNLGNIIYLPVLLILFPLFHLTYGFGTIYGFMKHRKN
jgi:glycosyltransferase involved in cell wall biosynthesis